MDAELLGRAKIRDIERETANIRLLATAERAELPHRHATPAPRPQAVRATPLRLLRALRPAS